MPTTVTAKLSGTIKFRNDFFDLTGPDRGKVRREFIVDLSEGPLNSFLGGWDDLEIEVNDDYMPIKGIKAEIQQRLDEVNEGLPNNEKFAMAGTEAMGCRRVGIYHYCSGSYKLEQGGNQYDVEGETGGGARQTAPVHITLEYKTPYPF